MYSVDEYRKAYVEVLEVLEYLKKIDKEDYDKIPKDRIEHMEKEKDKNYIFVLEKKSLIKDQVCKLSSELLAFIYLNYIASNNKKIEIERKKAQIKNNNNGNIKIKPLFENKTVEEKQNRDEEYQTKDLTVKKESIFYKILKKIKDFFRGKFKYN